MDQQDANPHSAKSEEQPPRYAIVPRGGCFVAERDGVPLPFGQYSTQQRAAARVTEELRLESQCVVT